MSLSSTRNAMLDLRPVSENAEPGPTPEPRWDQRLRDRWNGLAQGPGVELDISARLGLAQLVEAVQQNTNAVVAMHEWLKSNPIGQGPTPRLWRASLIAGTSPATYTAVQFQTPTDAGGPNGGYRWWLGAHFIQGTDPFTTVASTVAALYVGAQPPRDSASAPDIEAIDSSIRYAVTTLPWGGSFAPRAIGIMPNDTVYYMVKGLSAAQKVTATIMVYEYLEQQEARWS
jgi:hypothetical protein